MRMDKVRSLKRITEKSIEWLPIVLKNLKPFNPEVSKFEINYKNKKAKLFYKIEIPENSIRDQIGKIVIPKTTSFKINDFFDGNFTNIINFIRFSAYDEAYIINLRNLPLINNFLIIFEGDLEPNLLNRLIRIQPAINKDSTEIHDKYWLDVMIRDIEILEKIYESLNVNEINCSVKVGVERYFTTELPSSLKVGINALNDFLSAGRESDRIKLFSAWMKYRRSIHNINKEELENFFRELAKKFFLKNYIEIDLPFYLGEIGSHEIEKIIPKSFSVEAMSDLSLKEPAASGYLKFNKKEYQKKIQEEIKENWG